MKAVLEFKLPEENYEYNMANNASKYHSTLLEYDQWLRSKIKYDELTDEQYEIYQKCRETLNEIASDNNVNIHDL